MDGIFLLLSVSDLVKDIERVVYLGKSSFLIGGSGWMMNCYFLSFLIDEIRLDLQDNIFYFSYLWETSHNRPSGRADLDLHSGLVPKRLEC